MKTAQANLLTDFLVTNHGSICVIDMLSDAAIAWANENLPDDAMRWGRHGYVVEPRYVANIVDGMEFDGLVHAAE